MKKTIIGLTILVSIVSASSNCYINIVGNKRYYGDLNITNTQISLLDKKRKARVILKCKKSRFSDLCSNTRKIFLGDCENVVVVDKIRKLELGNRLIEINCRRDSRFKIHWF